MDINLLLAILIALVPVVLTIIFSRLYNVVHGLITFLVMQYVLMFCLEVFGGNLPEAITKNFPVVCGLYSSFNDFVLSLLKGVPFIANLLAQSFGPYIILGVYVLVFLISQIIACAIRKSRVEKIKFLRRQLKRY